VVKTTVTHPKEGLVSIDYRLAQSNGNWRVRDIILDDVSLATNLRSQFHKIITEHSYDELLRLMREKLAE
jgi:phospholipid transport system substrate-binding protein